MGPYSVARVGSEYIVKVQGQSVLRLNSRRQAAKLVAVLVNEVPQTDARQMSKSEVTDGVSGPGRQILRAARSR
jgi:hypothetical protein